MQSSRVRLLLVDDQESVRETTAALLSDDFEVVSAADAQTALALYAAQPFDVVCADYNMPGMNGAELLGRAKAIRPCAALLVTGHSDYASAIPAELRQDVAIVLKPYEPQMLVATAQRAYMILKARGLAQAQRKLA